MSLKQNIYGSLFVSNNITGNTLNLSTINENNSLTQLLVRDNSDGVINYRDVSSIISAATSADTFVTGFTYDDSNNLTISRNDGIDFTTSINIMSALTVTSLYGVNTIQDDGGELTIISDDFKIKGDGITIQDNGGNDKISIDTTISTPELSGEISFIDNQTFSSNVFVNNILTATTISATTYFGDGSNLTGIPDNFVSGGTYNVGTNNINFSGNNVVTTFDVDLSSLISSVSGDTFVISGNADVATSLLTFTNNSGGTFNVTNSAALFSDNDINVTGGTYNPSTGCVTFITNSGTTFDVCGFVTGITDTYTTGSTLVGETIQFDSNVLGPNYYNVSLSPVLSGKTDNLTFNSYTSNTQTILDGKIDSANNVGGTNEFFKDKSGTTLNFRTLSGGSNTTVSTVGDVVKVDVTIPPATNTFVSGGTYNDTTNNINFSGNSVETTFGVDLTSLVSSVSGDTYVVGGTYVDSTNTISLLRNDGNFVNVTGVTNTYVTGGTVSVPATNSSNDGTIGLLYKDSDGTPRTLPFKDNFVTGTTFSSNQATLTRNDGTDVLKLTGGTNVTLSNPSPSTNQIKIDVNIPSGMNTYVTGFTYNDNNTFTIFDNDGGVFPATINQMSGLTINGTLIVDTLSATTYTGLTLNDLDDVTTNIPTTPDATYQGELLYFDTVTNQWVSGEEYGNLGDVTIWGKKGSAGTIDKGCPVYIVGFDSDIHEVELANATTATTMPVIGFTAEDFDNAGVYPIVTFGKVTGVDTTSTVSTINPNGETWTVNDALFMNTTDGGLTKNRPSGSNTQIQRIAKILKVGSTDGQIFIFNTARTAGLPNLTTDYLWVGNGNDTPQELIKTDVGITTTGFTYNNNNTLTITDDNGGTLSTTINQMSGLTINGTLSATTIDGNTILSGGTNLITIIESLDTNTFVSGGTYNDTTNNINFSGNSVETTFDVDLTSLVSSVSGNTFVISGTYVDSTDTLSLLRNDGDFVNITGITDTFTTGSTYDNGTALATFTRNDGNTYTLDLSTIDVNDTFVTGFTYNNANTFTISRNDGVDLNSSFNTVTGLTVNGSLNATTILSGGTNLTTVIESLDTYVTGGTVSVPATNNTNSGSIGLFYKNSDGTPRTLPFEDTYTTGSTYDNGTALATFDRNDGTNYTLDLSTIDVNDIFSTGGTVTQTSSINENNQTIQIVGNGGFTPYNITNVTDTFTTGGTYNNGTALITFDKNDGTTYDVDLSSLDLNDTFVTGTTFSSNQATVTRNDGTDVLLLTGGTKISLSNPSSNQIKIDVTPELNIVTVSTTTYTATTSDEIIGVDTSSNAVTITLPDSLSSGTLRYEIKDIGFNSRKNPITIQAVGSDSIRTTSLVSSFTLSADGGAVVLINTATREWWQM
jgi:hypothetical protein